LKTKRDDIKTQHETDIRSCRFQCTKQQSRLIEAILIPVGKVYLSGNSNEYKWGSY